MKIPISWLRQYVDFQLSPQEIAEKLTLLGIEVEGILDTALTFSGIIVGKVLTASPHPNADRLRLTTVTDGKQEYQVVCAAENCRAGIVVAFAPIGAQLTDEQGKPWKIKKSKIRDIESFGMMCSEIELGLAKESKGIIELPEDWPLGADLASFYSDPILEISLTPNLGHCLSVLGIARELAAAIYGKAKRPHFDLREAGKSPIPNVIENLDLGPSQSPGAGRSQLARISNTGDVEIAPAAGAFASTRNQVFNDVRYISIKVANPDLCPHYACRVLRNIKVGPSPEWLQKRLQSAGMRPINSVVDATNFVMMELGQPLHAFDFDTISDHEIIVTADHEYKNFVTLDGKERALPPRTLLICDPKKPLAIAGIMGGESTAATEASRNILLESALFSPSSIRKTSRLLDLKTESSNRFDKGIDPSGVTFALDRAAALIQELAGGSIESRVEVIPNKQNSTPPKMIPLRTSRANSILGTTLSENEVAALLSRLEMKIHPPFTVEVPSYRNDITSEIDLIEEVARLFGYNNLPRKPSLYVSSPLADAPIYIFEQQIRTLLLEEGLQECITCDLISPQISHLTAEKTEPESISVLHPRSVEQSVLRTSLMPGLLQAAKTNFNHQVDNLALFEVGRIHFKEGEKFQEQTCAGILLSGKNRHYHYDPKPRESDFFDLKGIIENLIPNKITFELSHLHTLHPGRQAKVMIGNLNIGVLGEIHPNLAHALDLKPLFFAEINLHDLFPLKKREKKFTPLPSFPSSQRDWTIPLKIITPVGAVVKAIESAKCPFLETFFLLDLYPKDECKNVTFRFIYRDHGKTIDFETVEREHQKLTQVVAEKLKDALILA